VSGQFSVPHAVLILADERLRLPEALGEINLAYTGIDPDLAEQGLKLLLLN